MTKKVGLFSGKVLKVTGDSLTPDRFRFLRLAEAEPDLGTSTVDGSVLIGNTDNTREWSPDLFLTYPVDPDTSLPVTTLNVLGNLDVTGNITGIISIDIAPTSLSLPAGAVITIGGQQVLGETFLGDSVVDSNLSTVGTITAGTWQADPIQVPYGGTGRTSVTGNAMLAGDPTDSNVLKEVSGTSGELLQIHPTTGEPIFGAIDGGGY
jgi:hypothetical protein